VRTSSELKLGAFVLATSLAFAFLVLTFGEIPLFKPPTKTYIVYFHDVGGLTKGAEVRVAGIRMGEVKDILLEGGRVKVVFTVEEGVELYRDASATIGTLGLMGDKYLAINPGTPESGELSPGDVLRTTEGVADTDILIRELTRTAESFRLVAENLNRILAENRENLRLTVEHLNALTATLRAMLEDNRQNMETLLIHMAQLMEKLNRDLPKALASIERLADELGDITAENRENVKALLSNMKVLSDALREDLPPLIEGLSELVNENREDVRAVVRNLSDITSQLRHTARRLDNILRKIEKGEGTIGKLITEDELYESVTKGAKLFGEAGEVITETKLFVGFGGELYSGGDTKGFLSLRIEPERKTYYLLEVVGDSRGRVYTEQIIGGDEIVKKEFKPEFTLQIAKRFFVSDEAHFVVRAGLKESTGGVGFDFVPSKRVRLFSDVWDTGRKDRPGEEGLKPLLQVGVELKLRGPLRARFGGDDLLNDRLRGAFAGVGLEFSEEYLKYLLGGLGLPFP